MNIEEMKNLPILEEITSENCFFSSYDYLRWLFVLWSKRITNFNSDVLENCEMPDNVLQYYFRFENCYIDRIELENTLYNFANVEIIFNFCNCYIDEIKLKNLVEYANYANVSFMFESCYINGMELENLVKDVDTADINFRFKWCHIKNIELFKPYIKDNTVLASYAFQNCKFDSIKDIKGFDESFCAAVDCDCKEFSNYECPDAGEFVGYKKCYIRSIGEYCIVKLLIPEDAKRLTALNSHKCRCSKAKVIGIYTTDGKDISGKGYIPTNTYYTHGPTTYYGLNDTVHPDDYCPYPSDVCSNGIHFFMNFLEARYF